jgi:PhoPQ-activated pathogenicity-related protein
MVFALAIAAAMAGTPSEFGDYLALPDTSFSWGTENKSDSALTLALTSQTWRGIPWHHTLALVQPRRLAHNGAAILVVTGWVINPADMADAQSIADKAGMAVAMLFDIPNQPIFELREDNLIAYTFDKYVESGDATWPLLFPMAKSAIRAMDALQEATRGSENPLQRFVVTGESKRGWTTWFVGASGDPRVVGIAPMIIDNLNLTAQMPHQLRIWGKYSEMIEAYTERGLQAKTSTPRGLHLAEIVDPYSYRSRIKAPTLIVNGSNDPYWATDALSLYWDGLRQPKSVLAVPNAHHDLGDKTLAFETLAAFARSAVGELRWPSVAWSYRDGKPSFAVRGPAPDSAVLWEAESDSMDFRPCPFHPIATIDHAAAKGAFNLPPSSRNRAFFIQLDFHEGESKFSLSTRTWLEKGH